jgi:hypothetical protein
LPVLHLNAAEPAPPSQDARRMSTFYKLLGVALLVVTTNTFVWFAGRSKSYRLLSQQYVSSTNATEPARVVEA